jgi:cholesterol transport system auxiliary component
MTITSPFSLNRRLVLAGASAIVLASCSDILGPPDAPKLFVLKSGTAAAATGPKVSWALSIQLPDASAALDTQRIAIMRPPASLDYYADAAWSDHLPALVQTALLEAFESSGCIAAVARDSDAARADYILVADLRDFEARYDQPDGAPTAVVHIGAKMVSALKRDIAARFDAAEEVPATQNSVDAAVAALDEALSRAVAKVVTWALSLPAPAE